jgi:hypothetical protein
MNDKPLTAERLRQVLHYDGSTGVFTRLTAPQPRFPVGSVAGTNHSRGYWVVTVDGRIYKAHRLAWLYAHGNWPDGEIDHINLVKTDNRLSNLRVVTRSENTSNRSRARVDNKLGLLGVSQVGNRYIARIAIGGSQRYLGIFKTPDQAKAAYDTARKALP